MGINRSIWIPSTENRTCNATRSVQLWISLCSMLVVSSIGMHPNCLRDSKFSNSVDMLAGCGLKLSKNRSAFRFFSPNNLSAQLRDAIFLTAGKHPPESMHIGFESILFLRRRIRPMPRLRRPRSGAQFQGCSNGARDEARLCVLFRRSRARPRSFSEAIVGLGRSRCAEIIATVGSDAQCH
jgi:hypothetical protein